MTADLHSRSVSQDRSVRLAMAGAAGFAGGAIVAVTWAASGPIAASVGALVAGFFAGVVVGTSRRALIAVACGTAPAVWIDLFIVPTPPVELGGFLQFAFGIATTFLAGLGLVGALIGAAAAKAERLDPVRSTRRRTALGIAALAALGSWVWIGAAMAATTSI